MRSYIFPARGGSKQISKKNIIEFFRKTIVSYSIEEVMSFGVFDQTIVSADSDEMVDQVIAAVRSVAG